MDFSNDSQSIDIGNTNTLRLVTMTNDKWCFVFVTNRQIPVLEVDLETLAQSRLRLFLSAYQSMILTPLQTLVGVQKVFFRKKTYTEAEFLTFDL